MKLFLTDNYGGLDASRREDATGAPATASYFSIWRLQDNKIKPIVHAFTSERAPDRCRSTASSAALRSIESPPQVFPMSPLTWDWLLVLRRASAALPTCHKKGNIRKIINQYKQDNLKTFREPCIEILWSGLCFRLIVHILTEYFHDTSSNRILDTQPAL